MGNFYEELGLKAGTGTEGEKRIINWQIVTRCFTLIFITSIVAIVASFLSEISSFFNLVGITAGFIAAGAMICIGVCEKKQVGRYVMAGIGQVLQCVITIIELCTDIDIDIDAIDIIDAQALHLFMVVIVCIIINFVGTFCEGQAYTDTIWRLDEAVANKWQKYLKLYGITWGAAIVLFILTLIGLALPSLIYLVVLLALLISVVVLVIMRPCYLYSTIKCIKKINDKNVEA